MQWVCTVGMHSGCVHSECDAGHACSGCVQWACIVGVYTVNVMLDMHAVGVYSGHA